MTHRLLGYISTVGIIQDRTVSINSKHPRHNTNPGKGSVLTFIGDSFFPSFNTGDCIYLCPDDELRSTS